MAGFRTGEGAHESRNVAASRHWEDKEIETPPGTPERTSPGDTFISAKYQVILNF